MKTAIVFALVCLIGYSVADTCTLKCKLNGNANVGIVKLEGGVTIGVDASIKVVVSVGAKYAYIVIHNTDIRILVEKEHNRALYIKGQLCILIESQSVGAIFSGSVNFGDAVTKIRSEAEAAAASLRATFHFEVLLSKNSTIDFSLLVTGNVDVSNGVKTYFGEAFQIVKDSIGNVGTSVSIDICIAIAYENSSSVDADIILAFSLIVRAKGDLAENIGILIKAITNDQLAILIGVLQIGGDISNLSKYHRLAVTLRINGNSVSIVLIFGNGSFYLKYCRVGLRSSTISFFFVKETNLICITNSLIQYDLLIVGNVRILYSQTTGVGLVFSSSQVTLISAATLGVAVSEVTTTVLIGFAVSARATQLITSAGISLTAFVIACASSSSTALVRAYQGIITAELVIRIYAQFAQFFATFRGAFNVVILASILPTCVQLCLLSSSANAVVSAFGGAIDIFVKGASAAIVISIQWFISVVSSLLSVLLSASVSINAT